MLDDLGHFIQIDDGQIFVTNEPLSFKSAVELLASLGAWRMASIKDIEHNRTLLKSALKDLHQNVWVSDLIELETGPINIPKFYSCDLRLNSPKNGSLALVEHFYTGLYFSGIHKEYPNETKSESDSRFNSAGDIGMR